MGEQRQQHKKTVWGPALWLYLHVAADFCDDPEAFASLVLSLVGTLPCPECRKHLKEYTSRMLPSSSIIDKTSAVRYIKDLHNHVNSLIGKPPHPPPTRNVFSFPAATARVANAAAVQGIAAHAGGLPRPSLPPSAIQQQRPGGAARAPRAAAAAPRFRRH